MYLEEAARILSANAVIGPDPRMEGATDCYLVPTEDIDALNTALGDKLVLPWIVCLCGSTRFMDTFFEEGWRLTLEGKIVLSVGVCKHVEDHGGEALGPDVVEALDELHLRKIDLADEVRILNVGGYIGESTRNELEYARAQKRVVTFLEET